MIKVIHSADNVRHEPEEGRMDQRSARISVRLRTGEKRVIENAAAQEGATVSGFVRAHALRNARDKLTRILNRVEAHPSMQVGDLPRRREAPFTTNDQQERSPA